MELDVRWYWKLVYPPAASLWVHKKKVAPAAGSACSGGTARRLFRAQPLQRGIVVRVAAAGLRQARAHRQRQPHRPPSADAGVLVRVGHAEVPQLFGGVAGGIRPAPAAVVGLGAAGVPRDGVEGEAVCGTTLMVRLPELSDGS